MIISRANTHYNQPFHITVNVLFHKKHITGNVLNTYNYIRKQYDAQKRSGIHFFLSCRSIATGTGIHYNTANRHINILIRKGYIGRFRTRWGRMVYIIKDHPLLNLKLFKRFKKPKVLLRPRPPVPHDKQQYFYKLPL